MFFAGVASSRPSSSLSHQSTSSVTSSVNLRTKPVAAPRRPRPASIAVTGISASEKNGTVEPKKQTKPPLPKTRHSTVRKSQEKLESNIKKAEKQEKKKKSLPSPSAETPQHIPVMHSPVENKSVEKAVESKSAEQAPESLSAEKAAENKMAAKSLDNTSTDSSATVAENSVEVKAISDNNISEDM